MRPRFFAPAVDPSRAEVRLPADEARHLTRVLRLGAGAEVEVFDGRGGEWLARVASAERERVTLTVVDPLPPSPMPAVAVTLAQAVLKGDHMDDVVRDATMLGVAAIQPLVTAHVAVPARAVEHGRPVERWRRIALASVKQSRRATIPEIREPVAVQAWLERGEGRGSALALMLVEPSVTSVVPRPLRSLLSEAPPASATLIVGPEGGWSADEVAAAVEAGCVPVTLGPLTLRADAVPLVALSALVVLWERLSPNST